MKKKKYFIIIGVFLLFILGSSYRFVQLNKDAWGQELYTEVDHNSTFSINGINFELEKVEILDNVDDQGSTDLKFTINLYKHGEITSQGFDIEGLNMEPFYKDYSTDIILNIMDKKERVIGNYPIEYEGYTKDNPKFTEIQRGERPLSEKKERLVLRFSMDKDTMQHIYDNTYQVKLVFPKDRKALKFNFIEIHIDQLSGA